MTRDLFFKKKVAPNGMRAIKGAGYGIDFIKQSKANDGSKTEDRRNMKIQQLIIKEKINCDEKKIDRIMITGNKPIIQEAKK